MGLLKHTVQLIVLFWLVPTALGFIIGMRKERLRPCVILSVLLSWVGVIIAVFFLRDDSPIAKRKRINKRLNEPSPHARRRIHAGAVRLPQATRTSEY